MTTTLKTYTEYKKSRIEWLEEVPRDWSMSKITELYVRKKERSNVVEELLSVYRDYGVVLTNSRDDNHNKPSEDLSNYILVQPGDLVINKMKAWQGSVAISQYRGLVSPAYFSYGLTSAGRKKLDLQYFHHLLRSRMYIETYRRISTGIRPGQWDLDPYQFKILRVPIPPLETQKNIAIFLDCKLKAIDELVVKKGKMIELLHEKRAALITDATTKGLNSETKMRQTNCAWLGDIPADWTILPFRALFHEKNEPNKRGAVKNVLSLSYGKIVDRDVASNFGLLPASFDTYQIIEPGWIVFRLTDLQNDHKSLRTGLATKRGIITSAYLAVAPAINIQARYAAYLLHTYDLCKVFYGMGGGIRQTIGYFDLKWLPTILPPNAEQKEIADYLDAETMKMDRAIALIESQIAQFREYRSSLIYSAVTGKIKV